MTVQVGYRILVDFQIGVFFRMQEMIYAMHMVRSQYLLVNEWQFVYQIRIWWSLSASKDQTKLCIQHLTIFIDLFQWMIFNTWSSISNQTNHLHSAYSTWSMYLTHLSWQYWNSNAFKLFNGIIMDSWINELFTQHAFLSSSPYTSQNVTQKDTYLDNMIHFDIYTLPRQLIHGNHVLEQQEDTSRHCFS